MFPSLPPPRPASPFDPLWDLHACVLALLVRFAGILYANIRESMRGEVHCDTCPRTLLRQVQYDRDNSRPNFFCISVLSATATGETFSQQTFIVAYRNLIYTHCNVLGELN